MFDVLYTLPEHLPRPTSKLSAGPSAAQEAEFAAALEKQLHPQISLRPLEDDSRVRIKAFSASEAFSIWLKASLIVGVLISSPWVFYHIWAFVAAGLYPHEKRYVHVFLPFSLGLFLLGAATAYLFVFGPVLEFLFSFNRWLGIEADQRISEWLGFVLLLPLGFGISFQLPLVMLFLERIGVFSVEAYLSKWRLAVLVIFILSAVLTPADPYSLLLMACPLTLLYFFGILLCRTCRGGKTLDERSTTVDAQISKAETANTRLDHGRAEFDSAVESTAIRIRGQMASEPRSPVRMRMQSSSGRMKILPSPISPCGPLRPPLTMAAIVGSTNSSLTAIWSCTLRSRFTENSCPR